MVAQEPWALKQMSSMVLLITFTCMRTQSPLSAQPARPVPNLRVVFVEMTDILGIVEMLDELGTI